MYIKIPFNITFDAQQQTKHMHPYNTYFNQYLETGSEDNFNYHFQKQNQVHSQVQNQVLPPNSPQQHFLPLQYLFQANPQFPQSNPHLLSPNPHLLNPLLSFNPFYFPQNFPTVIMNNQVGTLNTSNITQNAVANENMTPKQSLIAERSTGNQISSLNETSIYDYEQSSSQNQRPHFKGMTTVNHKKPIKQEAQAEKKEKIGINQEKRVSNDEKAGKKEKRKKNKQPSDDEWMGYNIRNYKVSKPARTPFHQFRRLYQKQILRSKQLQQLRDRQHDTANQSNKTSEIYPSQPKNQAPTAQNSSEVQNQKDGKQKEETPRNRMQKTRQNILKEFSMKKIVILAMLQYGYGMTQLRYFINAQCLQYIDPNNIPAPLNYYKLVENTLVKVVNTVCSLLRKEPTYKEKVTFMNMTKARHIVKYLRYYKVYFGEDDRNTIQTLLKHYLGLCKAVINGQKVYHLYLTFEDIINNNLKPRDLAEMAKISNQDKNIDQEIQYKIFDIGIRKKQPNETRFLEKEDTPSPQNHKSETQSSEQNNIKIQDISDLDQPIPVPSSWLKPSIQPLKASRTALLPEVPVQSASQSKIVSKPTPQSKAASKPASQAKSVSPPTYQCYPPVNTFLQRKEDEVNKGRLKLKEQLIKIFKEYDKKTDWKKMYKCIQPQYQNCYILTEFKHTMKQIFLEGFYKLQSTINSFQIIYLNKYMAYIKHCILYEKIFMPSFRRLALMILEIFDEKNIDYQITLSYIQRLKYGIKSTRGSNSLSPMERFEYERKKRELKEQECGDEEQCNQIQE